MEFKSYRKPDASDREAGASGAQRPPASSLRAEYTRLASASHGDGDDSRAEQPSRSDDGNPRTGKLRFEEEGSRPERRSRFEEEDSRPERRSRFEEEDSRPERRSRIEEEDFRAERRARLEEDDFRAERRSRIEEEDFRAERRPRIEEEDFRAERRPIFDEDDSRAERQSRFEEGNPREEQPRRKPARPASRPMPRRRRRDPAAIIVPILLCAAVLAAIVYVGSSWLISTMNESTYCSNIFINGIDISRFSKEEGMEYVREQSAEQLSATHTLSWQGNSWSFSANDFGASIETDNILERAWNIGHVGNIFDRSSSIRALKRNPIYLTAPVSYNEAQVDSLVDEIYNALYVPPRNATVVADLSSPQLAEESSEGQELDRETARAQIVSLLETGEGGDVLPVLTLEPSLSTEEAMSTLNLIVEYKTDTTARGYYGRFNVRKGLSYFYGMIVQPGEEVSFNEVVGPRTKERGWQPGTEYIGGGKSQEGYGGGICQASSTLYGALLRAGMTILARSPHSMTVAYVDPSIDAAVTETGSKDLRFRNDTENAITIYTEVTKEYAMVQIYGARPKYRYELESHIISQDNAAKKTAYIRDEEGLYCYYTDETQLYSEGHAACISEGWLVAYDWDTNEEVERKQLSRDEYESGYDIYWRGVHSRDEEGGPTPSASAQPTVAATEAPPTMADFN